MFRIGGESIVRDTTGCAGDSNPAGSGTVQLSHYRSSQWGTDIVSVPGTVCGASDEVFTCVYRNHRTGKNTTTTAVALRAVNVQGRWSLTCPTPAKGDVPHALHDVTIVRRSDGFEFDAGRVLVGPTQMRQDMTCASLNDSCTLELTVTAQTLELATNLLQSQPPGSGAQVTLRLLAQNISSAGNSTSLHEAASFDLSLAFLQRIAAPGGEGNKITIGFSPSQLTRLGIVVVDISFNVSIGSRRTLAEVLIADALLTAWLATKTSAGLAASSPGTAATQRAMHPQASWDFSSVDAFSESLAENAVSSLIDTVMNMFPLVVVGKLAICLVINQSLYLTQTYAETAYLPGCPQTVREIEAQGQAWEYITRECDKQTGDMKCEKRALGMCFGSRMDPFSSSRAKCCYDAAGQYRSSESRFDIFHPTNAAVRHYIADTLMKQTCCSVGLMDVVKIKPVLKAARLALAEIFKRLAKLVSREGRRELIGDFLSDAMLDQLNGMLSFCGVFYEANHPIVPLAAMMKGDVKQRPPAEDPSRPPRQVPQFFSPVVPLPPVFPNRPPWGSTRFVNTGQITGDPQFLTVDGGLFSFNDAGEYLLLVRGNVSVQVRLSPLPATAASNGRQPTIVTAIAVGVVNSSRVSLVASTAGPPLRFWLDTIELTVPAGEPDAIVYPIGGPLEVIFNNSVASSPVVEVLYANVLQVSASVQRLRSGSIAISLRVAVTDRTFDNVSSTGMLGNRDGNVNNDICYRTTGGCIPLNSSEEDIHSAVRTWALGSERDSLFTYSQLFPFSSFQSPPGFLPLLHPPITPEVAAACNTSTSVSRVLQPGPWACAMDFAMTGDLDFSRQTEEARQQVVQLTANTVPPPRLRGTSGGTSSSAETLFVRNLVEEMSGANPSFVINASSESYDGSPLSYRPFIAGGAGGTRFTSVGGPSNGSFEVWPVLAANESSVLFHVNVTDSTGRSSVFTWTMQRVAARTSSQTEEISQTETVSSTSSAGETASATVSASRATVTDGTPSVTAVATGSLSDQDSLSASVTPTASPLPLSESFQPSVTKSGSLSLPPPDCTMTVTANGTAVPLHDYLMIRANCTTSDRLYTAVVGYYDGSGEYLQRSVRSPLSTKGLLFSTLLVPLILQANSTNSSQQDTQNASVTVTVILWLERDERVEFRGQSRVTVGILANLTDALRQLVAVQPGDATAAVEQSILLGALMRNGAEGAESNSEALQRYVENSQLVGSSFASLLDPQQQEKLLIAHRQVLHGLHFTASAEEPTASNISSAELLRKLQRAAVSSMAQLASAPAVVPSKVALAALGALPYLVDGNATADILAANIGAALGSALVMRATVGESVNLSLDNGWDISAKKIASLANAAVATRQGSGVLFSTDLVGGPFAAVALSFLSGNGTVLTVELRDDQQRLVTSFDAAPLTLQLVGSSPESAMGKQPQCAFFDTASQTWSAQGLQTVSFITNSATSILVCKSYHLTSFSAIAAREGADGKSSYSLTIGIMAGGLGCCFIDTVIVLAYLRFA